MTKNILHLITALWALALLLACTGSDDSPTPPPTAAAISFSTDVEQATAADATTTRATIDDLDALKDQLRGFGVFGYLTEGTPWLATAATPAGLPAGLATDVQDQLFYMYNQSVHWGQPAWSTDATDRDWVYAPLKYWPNTTDNSLPRYVSFFAYAPYITEDEAATATTGITGFSTAKTAGSHPYVDYVLGPVGQQADLLWASAFNATRNGNGLIELHTASDGTTTHTYQQVPLTFHHALCRIDIYVQRSYDDTYDDPHEAGDTKIFISRLKLSASGLAQKGRLLLEDGTWQIDPADRAAMTTITYDAETADIAPWIAGTHQDDNATAINNLELSKWDWRWNDDGDRVLADDEGYQKANQRSGVVAQERLLHQADQPLYLLPTEGALTLTPQLSYSFLTRDDALQYDYWEDASQHRYFRLPYTDVEGNSVTLQLQPGRRYKLLLHIDARHISFEVVSVEDWDFPLRFTTTVTDTEKETRPIPVKESHTKY